MFRFLSFFISYPGGYHIYIYIYICIYVQVVCKEGDLPPAVYPRPQSQAISALGGSLSG